jgi:hypothetical protein
MNTISKNGAGLAVLLLSLCGVEVTESAVVDAVSAVLTVISFSLMIWNQLERKDTKWFFFKK